MAVTFGHARSYSRNGPGYRATERENGPTEWAIPHISAAHVRTEPRHGAEMSTQALMGWPIAVLERLPDGWSYVELPDGYRGYVIDNSLYFCAVGQYCVLE